MSCTLRRNWLLPWWYAQHKEWGICSLQHLYLIPSITENSTSSCASIMLSLSTCSSLWFRLIFLPFWRMYFLKTSIEGRINGMWPKIKHKDWNLGKRQISFKCWQLKYFNTSVIPYSWVSISLISEFTRNNTGSVAGSNTFRQARKSISTSTCKKIYHTKLKYKKHFIFLFYFPLIL